MIKVMDLHVRQAHPSPGQQQQGQPGFGGRQERLPRPVLESGIREADWSFFVSQWERYKRSTKVANQDAIDQLWACASEELARQCHDAGATKDITEDQLLALFKQCSIRAQNKLVNVVEFLNLAQEGDEPMAKFICHKAQAQGEEHLQALPSRGERVWKVGIKKTRTPALYPCISIRMSRRV